jgi:hypothetical protein
MDNGIRTITSHCALSGPPNLPYNCSGCRLDASSCSSPSTIDQGKTGSEAYKELKRVNVLEQPSMGGAIGVLDWTGPGLYTDAVMRSILYQHVLERSRTRLTSTAT